MGLQVREMTEEDLDRVYEINRLSFTTDAWSMDSLKREFSLPYSLRFVLEEGDEIVGYAVLWLIKDEAFIMTFAIHPERRGKGLGKSFLSELIERLRGRAKVVQLDVRKSNLPAIRLYRSLGFRIVRERDKFYSDGENALVMEVELVPELV
ncbi:ribosomal protein S18-alanine N-acetyltransferase [Hydrogenivirga sp.]